MSHVIISLT